ncbi:MAG: 2-amino-4-hydroxy-6-hydroxymethyldihydropteridine diphosphokinase [Sphingobium sp.]
MARATKERHVYAIALGSNRARRGGESPHDLLRAAIDRLTDARLTLLARSSIIESAPIGPSLRRYANAAVLIETEVEPMVLLHQLKAIEGAFGRRSGGQRWGARPLDLDIILWSGGMWASKSLSIPHPAFRKRDFVLRPLVQIAPDWRDPVTGYTIRQLLCRMSKFG